MKPRIAVIGGGVYGTQVIQTYFRAHKEGKIDFVAICDVNIKVLNELCTKYGLKGYENYEEMLDGEQLDGIAIVTPDYLHKEIALNCINRKINVFVQKPLDTSVYGAREMVRAANENNVILYVDFHKRFDPAHINLKNDIKSGRFGKIQYGYVCMEDKILVPSVWFKEWAQHSSPVWFLGIHFFDLVHWLLEEKPVSVYSTGIKHKLLEMGIDTYDSIQSKFTFEGGASFTFDTSWIIPNSFPSIVNQQIRIVGSEGLEEVDSQDRGIIAAFSESSSAIQANPYGKLEVEDVLFGGSVLKGYTLESMLYFINIINLAKSGHDIENLKKLYPNGEEAVVSTVMAEAAHRSIEEGKIIKINW